MLLHESSATPLERKGNRWRAVFITPGEGSSGTYAESMLAEYAPSAFPPGTKHWFKHPDKPGDQRDPRDQWGVTAESHYEPGVGFVGEIEVLEHWRPVVESLGKAGQASLSIWSEGEKDDQGNVTALLPSVSNSVDLVAYPGRPGSGLTEQMFESARAASGEQPGVTSASQEKEGKQMEKELEALKSAVETLTSALTTFITESKAAEAARTQAEADAQANAQAVEKAVEEAIDSYDEKVRAIDAADLLPSQAESLRAEARKGVDVAPLIESAKAVVEEARETLNESANGGSIVSESKYESATGALPKGW